MIVLASAVPTDGGPTDAEPTNAALASRVLANARRPYLKARPVLSHANSGRIDFDKEGSDP